MFGDLPYTTDSHGAIANDGLDRFRLLLDYRADRSASMIRVGLALRFDDDGSPVIQQITDANAPETLAALKASASTHRRPAVQNEKSDAACGAVC